MAKHEEKEQILMIPLECEAINKTTISTDLATKQAEGKEAKSWSELVPPPYHQHAKVFSKEEAKRLPPHRKWDHAIVLTADAPKTLKCKTYPLTLKEQDAIDEIINEQLSRFYLFTLSFLSLIPCPLSLVHPHFYPCYCYFPCATPFARLGSRA